jgi:hypothetical protein
VNDPCPQLEILERLLTGDLASQDDLTLCCYVETCPKCQQFLEHLTQPATLSKRKGPSRTEIQFTVPANALAGTVN